MISQQIIWGGKLGESEIYRINFVLERSKNENRDICPGIYLEISE